MEEERKERLTKATIQANLKQDLKITIIDFFLLLPFSVFCCLLINGSGIPLFSRDGLLLSCLLGSFPFRC